MAPLGIGRVQLYAAVWEPTYGSSGSSAEVRRIPVVAPQRARGLDRALGERRAEGRRRLEVLWLEESVYNDVRLL